MIIVTLHSGPKTGKTTIIAAAIARLKVDGIKAVNNEDGGYIAPDGTHATRRLKGVGVAFDSATRPMDLVEMTSPDGTPPGEDHADIVAAVNAALADINREWHRPELTDIQRLAAIRNAGTK